jgi:glycerophosphoryl diester phosphodiesterase
MFIIGHRGARGVEPENTLLAVRTGMACADYVEVDVRLTRDRIPVIMHDLLLDRTTNGAGPVNEYTLEKLKAFDAGKGEKIPTLEEVCSIVKGHCGLVVEIKEPGSESEICSVLRGNPPENLFIVSFHPESILLVKDLLSGVKTGIIYSRALADLPGDAKELGADAILLKFALLTGKLVMACHKKSLLIISWTLDTPEEFRIAHDLGIDGLATDDPCRARHYFMSR